MKFIMNGSLWNVMEVYSDSPYLVDRTGKLTLATTDPMTHYIYLSNALSGDFRRKVLVHELTHVCLWEYDILEDIERFSKPEHRIDMEELVCNIMADYAYEIYDKAYKIIGEDAIHQASNALEKLCG